VKWFAAATFAPEDIREFWGETPEEASQNFGSH
jgi:hypothetical protein